MRKVGLKLSKCWREDGRVIVMAALAGMLVRLYELLFWFQGDTSWHDYDRLTPPGIAERRERWRRRIARMRVHLFG